LVKSALAVLKAGTSRADRKSALGRSHGVHRNVISCAVSRHFAELGVGELAFLQEGDEVLISFLTLFRFLEQFGAIEVLEAAFLELDGVDAGLFGDVHERFGEMKLPVVVEPDLGNDVTGVSWADDSIAYLHRLHDS
jgi:hypothetical protein